MHHALIFPQRLLGRCLSMTFMTMTTTTTLSLRHRLTNHPWPQHPTSHVRRHSRSLTPRGPCGLHPSENYQRCHRRRRPSPLIPLTPPHHSHPHILTSPTLLRLRQILARHYHSEVQMGISPRLYYRHPPLIHGGCRPMWGGRRAAVLVLHRLTRTRGRELHVLRFGSVLMSGYCRLCFRFFILFTGIHCNNR